MSKAKIDAASAARHEMKSSDDRAKWLAIAKSAAAVLSIAVGGCTDNGNAVGDLTLMAPVLVLAAPVALAHGVKSLADEAFDSSPPAGTPSLPELSSHPVLKDPTPPVCLAPGVCSR